MPRKSPKKNGDARPTATNAKKRAAEAGGEREPKEGARQAPPRAARRKGWCKSKRQSEMTANSGGNAEPERRTRPKEAEQRTKQRQTD